MEERKLYYMQILMDLIVIVLLIGALVYFYSNKEYAAAFVNDPCRVCEGKTGGKCVQSGDLDVLTQQAQGNINRNNEIKIDWEALKNITTNVNS